MKRVQTHSASHGQGVDKGGGIQKNTDGGSLVNDLNVQATSGLIYVAWSNIL